MSYEEPSVNVFQNLGISPSASVTDRPALILGPDLQTVRFSNLTERALGLLGAYDSANETGYVWPGKEAGAVVDQAAARLHVVDGLLRYFASTSQVIESTYQDDGFRNRLRCATLAFQTANGTSRSAVFRERDVKVGDHVKVTGTDLDDETLVFNAKVSGFVADPVAAAVDASEDDDNQATVSAGATVTAVSGNTNTTALESGDVDASAYDGAADGDVEDVYTVEVLSTVPLLVSITSASGNDDVASLAVTVDEEADLGTRGATFTLGAGSGLAVGQAWEVAVRGTFTAVTATAAGTYTGLEDTTYVIEVTKGGDFADSPKISVSTTTGLDASGPHTVTSTSPILIGQYGVTVALSGQPLRKGDRFFVDATAASEGAVRTLVLDKSLPLDFLGAGDIESSLPTPDVAIELSLVRTVEIPKNRIGHAPAVNFSTSATEITVKDGILLQDAEWVDADGDQLDLSLVGGTLHAGYSAFRAENTTEVQYIEAGDSLSDFFTTTGVDNPIALAVSIAMANSAGARVGFLAVPSSDIDDWNAALDILTVTDDVYGIVPCSQDPEVVAAVAAHVASVSGPDTGRWRTLFCSPLVPRSFAVSADMLATISDDPDTSGAQNTIVIAEGASFVSDGVRPGDTLRYAFQQDGFGSEAYATAAIDAVISEDELRLVSGPSAAVNVAAKIEVWRTRTNAEQATAVAASSASFGDRRVRALYPDVVEVAGTSVPGYHLGAAAAGLRSGTMPHQGLTGISLAGLSGVSALQGWSRSNLNTAAAGGTWLVVRSTRTGAIYTRHALTTDMASVNYKEEAVTSNIDDISYTLLNAFASFRGRTNVTPGNLEYIRTSANGILEAKNAVNTSVTLGSQITEIGDIVVAPHPVFRDRAVMAVNPLVPYALNNLEIHISLA